MHRCCMLYVWMFEQRIYSMEHRPRGRAVVISNRYFLKADLEVRDGAEFDEYNLCTLFKQLHFDVQLYSNKSTSVCVVLSVVFCRFSYEF